MFAAGTIDDGLSGEFDSSLVLPGASFEWSPTEVGEVQHFCYVHPWMFGTIIVQEAAAMTEPKDGERMKDDASATGMLSDGTVVKIWADVPTEGEMMEIYIKFANYGDAMMEDKMMEDDAMMEDKMMEDDAMMEDKMMEDDAMMDGKTGVEHVNYDIVITQNGVEVLNDEGVHTHDGKNTHMTSALASADPVDIKVTFNGFGLPGDEFTGPVGEEVTAMNVVPEFGTIAMMVLAVAIIGIVAVTAKSRMVPRL